MSTRRPLATPAEVAEYLRTTPESLAQMRYRGTGPRFTKPCGRVLYQWSDVDEWVATHSATSTGVAS